MKIYSLRKLVEIAKKKSPFYRKIYKNVKMSNFRLSDLPIINEVQFWKANSSKNNQILTESKIHGILLRSGGTTGKPKTSIFSSEEWSTMCKIMSHNLNKTKFWRTNDRVVNMFSSYSLYGAYLLTHDKLQGSLARVLELPIGLGQSQSLEDVVSIIKDVKANVIMSPPTSLVSIAYYVKTNNIKGVNIDRFLYGADLLLESQYQFIKNVFPRAMISSSGYASTDAGFLGYADYTCKRNEYRTDNHFTIMEIVDEKTGEVIEDENIKGRLIVTNLTKVLMPVIRYPVGDLAMWCEPKGHKFRKLKLLGRLTKKDDLLTFGDKDYDYQDFYEIIKKSKYCGNVLGFQIVSSKKNTKFKIAYETTDRKAIKLAKNEVKRLLIDSIPGMDAQSIEIELLDIIDLLGSGNITRTYKAVKIVRE